VAHPRGIDHRDDRTRPIELEVERDLGIAKGGANPHLRVESKVPGPGLLVLSLLCRRCGPPDKNTLFNRPPRTVIGKDFAGQRTAGEVGVELRLVASNVLATIEKRADAESKSEAWEVDRVHDIWVEERQPQPGGGQATLIS